MDSVVGLTLVRKSGILPALEQTLVSDRGTTLTGGRQHDHQDRSRFLQERHASLHRQESHTQIQRRP